MRAEIADGHYSGQEERHRTTEQAQHDEGPAERFDESGCAQHGIHGHAMSTDPSEPSEEFLPSMLGESETGHNPQQGA